MTLAVTRYDAARREGVFALMDAVWGSWLSPEEFDWWFLRNPAGRASIALAELDGRVVGMAAIGYVRARVDGAETLLPLPQQMATHPDARGRGIFETLARANEREAVERGARLEIGFPNDAAHPIWKKKLGWEDLPPVRLWARPLRPLAAAIRVRGGSPRGRVGLAGRSAAAVRLGGIEVRRLERVEDAPEEAPGARSHVVHDPAHLNWRYADAPRDYRLLGAVEGGRTAGVAALGLKAFHGIAAAYVADVIAGSGRVARALLRAAVAEARGGADVVVASPPPALRRAFLAAGFVPTPMTFKVGGTALPEGPLPEAARDWHFSLGDTDFF